MPDEIVYKCEHCGNAIPGDGETLWVKCGQCGHKTIIRDNPEPKLATRQPGNAAQCGKFHPRFDLLPPIAVRRWAETFGEGAEKYGENNWTKGLPMKQCLDHAIAHLMMWQRGDETEDHLAHAMWNIGAMIHNSETRPDLDDRDPRMMDLAVKTKTDREILFDDGPKNNGPQTKS